MPKSNVMFISTAMVKTLTTTSIASVGMAILLGIAAILGKNQLEDLREGQKEYLRNQANMAVTIEQLKASDALALQKLAQLEKQANQNGDKLDVLLNRAR